MSGSFRIALTWHAAHEDFKEYESYLSTASTLLNPKTSDIEDLKAVAREADAVVGVYVPQEVVDAAPNLKMVQILHAGLSTATPGDTVLGFAPEALAKRNITLGNIHGNAQAVAEHAMAFIFAMAKQIVPVNEAVSRNEWYPFVEATKSDMLCDSTLGIVGLGHIGIIVATMAKALGMHVIAVDTDPGRERVKAIGLDRVETPDALSLLLKEADFVHVTVPLTKRTMNMISEPELRQMKSSAYLINTARAGLIDERALHKALTEGWIKGYASDVWWFYSYSVSANSTTRNESESWFDFGFHYSVPSRLGVNRLPNVIGTNDRASYTKGLKSSFVKAGLQNVDELAQGRTPPNIVNAQAGY